MFRKNNLLVEIGSKTIKIVNYKKTKTNKSVTDYRIIEMKEELFNDDGIPILDTIVPLMADSLLEMNVKKGNVRLVIGSKQVVSRVREVPCVPKNEMKDMVFIESEQFLPYSSSEFYIDYRILGEVERENDLKLFKAFIAAVPKEIIDAYMGIFNKLKCTVVSININVDTTHLFIEKYLVSEGKNIIVADMGFDTMKMIVYKEQYYFVSLNANRGVKTILSSIKAEKGFTDEQAIEFLVNPNGNNNENEMSPHKTIEQNVDEKTLDKVAELRKRLALLKHNDNSLNMDSENKIVVENDAMLNEFFNNYALELRRMIDFFRSREFGATVHEIHLIGGGASIKGVEKYLNDSLAVPVKVIDVSSYYDIDFIREDDKQMLVPALGSLLGGGC